MAEPKTRPTDVPVEAFIDAVLVQRRRDDAHVVDAMMREVTGLDPVMWGPSIIGYGSVDNTTADGAVNPWPAVAFSPRKTELVFYLDSSLEASLYERLGPHRRSVACLYVKRLEQVDVDVLREMIAISWKCAQRG